MMEYPKFCHRYVAQPSLYKHDIFCVHFLLEIFEFTKIPQNCDCESSILYLIIPSYGCISLRKCFDNRNIASFKSNIDFDNSRNLWFLVENRIFYQIFVFA